MVCITNSKPRIFKSIGNLPLTGFQVTHSGTGQGCSESILSMPSSEVTKVAIPLGNRQFNAVPDALSISTNPFISSGLMGSTAYTSQLKSGYVVATMIALEEGRLNRRRGSRRSGVTKVVSGTPGVDALGEQWAERHGIPVTRFPADWKRYGRRAGPTRN
jgi:hypothetical protein